jgi:hypothetical protein
MSLLLNGTDGVTYNDGSNQPAAASPYVLKNRLVNGSFNVAQRGTSFTSTSSLNNDDTYNLDRWFVLSDGNDIVDITQTTTVPTGAKYSIGLDVETVNKKFGIAQIIENVNCYDAIGGNVTLSFQAKVSATTKLDNVKCAVIAWSGTEDTVTSDIISAWEAEGTNPTLIANATYENTPANLNLTTLYATYSVSAAVDTASTQNLILFIWSDVTDTTAGDFLYIAESKLELGSTASAFEYAGGTIQGELATCQRYYTRYTNAVTNGQITGTVGYAVNTTIVDYYVALPVQMRVQPTTLDFSNIQVYVIAPATNYTTGTWTTAVSTYDPKIAQIRYTHGSGVFTTGQIASINSQTTSGYVGLSAEL